MEFRHLRNTTHFIYLKSIVFIQLFTWFLTIDWLLKKYYYHK